MFNFFAFELVLELNLKVYRAEKVGKRLGKEVKNYFSMLIYKL